LISYSVLVWGFKLWFYISVLDWEMLSINWFLVIVVAIRRINRIIRICLNRSVVQLLCWVKFIIYETGLTEKFLRVSAVVGTSVAVVNYFAIRFQLFSCIERIDNYESLYYRVIHKNSEHEIMNPQMMELEEPKFWKRFGFWKNKKTVTTEPFKTDF
jgi:hypothetical protein